MNIVLEVFLPILTQNNTKGQDITRQTFIKCSHKNSVKWVNTKQKTITNKEGMFIEMFGSKMVLSSNVVTKYWVVIQALLKM